MTNVEINKQARLSQHFTLGELCKTSANLENVPNEAQVNNLKRLCGWLEELRRRPSPSPSLLREGSEEPIIINSGYRSPEVNRAVGGVPDSNHLTGCAVDIHVTGLEQLIHYASTLLDISDERQEDFDELLLERSPRGTYWLHFAVRPSGNRRRVRLIQT
ncbi:D-Ala-D-Ala carboxypeptidase family metallohydrolase [uncultured Prevotella sp.]|uniref:D-Ala-D-Ala carboxypeptidase family metallohydrolase n=1 Tax=uncultured Prevotella sp. TaxID=159272 RepID=UPI0026010E57|nr:D-Ala-D-Ala carboxypeptidase family metallohydrolase [uncultured Prevotella sp.]